MEQIQNVSIQKQGPPIVQALTTPPKAEVNAVQPDKAVGQGPHVAVPKSKLVELKLDNQAQIHQYSQTKAKLERVMSDLQKSLADGGRGLSFSVDEQSGRYLLLVKKSETGEVIRQIPSEVVMRVANNFDQLKGLLFNETT